VLYDYSRLIGRIGEVFESQAAFGVAMGWSPATTIRKLSNELQWKSAEIEKAISLLNISPSDCSFYFFKLKA
jgi:hypothetical protein